MRHRGRGTKKIKLEHNLVPGLGRLLRTLEPWPEIDGIVPGEIKKSMHGSSITLTIQYETRSGLKCLARSSRGVQEIFFITSQPKALRDRLNKFLETRRAT